MSGNSDKNLNQTDKQIGDCDYDQSERGERDSLQKEIQKSERQNIKDLNDNQNNLQSYKNQKYLTVNYQNEFLDQYMSDTDNLIQKDEFVLKQGPPQKSKGIQEDQNSFYHSIEETKESQVGQQNINYLFCSKRKVREEDDFKSRQQYLSQKRQKVEIYREGKFEGGLYIYDSENSSAILRQRQEDDFQEFFQKQREVKTTAQDTQISPIVPNPSTVQGTPTSTMATTSSPIIGINPPTALSAMASQTIPTATASQVQLAVATTLAQNQSLSRQQAQGAIRHTTNRNYDLINFQKLMQKLESEGIDLDSADKQGTFAKLEKLATQLNEALIIYASSKNSFKNIKKNFILLCNKNFSSVQGPGQIRQDNQCIIYLKLMIRASRVQ